jgi:hypothetical protein
MTVHHVDGLTFDFPSSWLSCKYDEWDFYRNQFGRIQPGIKAVDLIVLNPDTAWMIEVKDYRVHRRTKIVDIHQEFAEKVLHTLSALLPAKANANNSTEKSFATEALRRSRLRLVLHLEQPAKHSKLFPRAINPLNVQLKLRQVLKAIDPHPIVAETGRMHGLVWSVE